MKEYSNRMKKHEMTLLKCLSTTTLGVSNPSSPFKLRSYMFSTASNAVPCVVKSVAAHQLMNAINVQKIAPTCGGAMFNPPYRTIDNPVPEIIETVNAGTTINPSNSGTFVNQKFKTLGLLLCATARSIHVVRIIPPPNNIPPII